MGSASWQPPRKREQTISQKGQQWKGVEDNKQAMATPHGGREHRRHRPGWTPDFMNTRGIKKMLLNMVSYWLLIHKSTIGNTGHTQWMPQCPRATLKAPQGPLAAGTAVAALPEERSRLALPGSLLDKTQAQTDRQTDRQTDKHIHAQSQQRCYPASQGSVHHASGLMFVGNKTVTVLLAQTAHAENLCLHCVQVGVQLQAAEWRMS